MTRFHTRAALMRLALLLAALTGCATETRVLPERAIERPRWIDLSQDTLHGRRMFVGVAVADNALDEAQGRARALENAAENLLRAIAMDIEHKHKAAPAREGAQRRAGEETGARSHDFSGSEIAWAVRSLRPVEFYREKWFVREANFGQGFWRYKFHVLAVCGEDEYRELAEWFEAEHAAEP